MPCPSRERLRPSRIGSIVLHRSPDAARQLASRGRRRIRGADTTLDAVPAAQQEVVEAFLAAARDGDFDARGAANVARRALAASQPGLVARPALVNGAAGWVALLDGDAYAIAALTLQDGRITTMHILLDPARLARLDLAAFDPPR